MGELLHVSSSPHIRSKVTTDYLMKMVNADKNLFEVEQRPEQYRT